MNIHDGNIPPIGSFERYVKKETGVGGHEKHKTKTYGSKRREKY